MSFLFWEMRGMSDSDEVDELGSLMQKLDKSVLSSPVTQMEGRISEQTRVFEAEQTYRRDCEYFFGTNGYGEGGEKLSEGLGV
jgi:hypothetical protein